ncbi:MAG: zinc-dependent alcohol dehydrogenase family protein [Nakamurella sp.]
MLAAVFDTIRQPPVVRDVPAPSCPADGAVIRVEATGVCRSDWHAWRGHDPVALPHIPGHEFAGTIAELGPAVRQFRVGQRVTAPFVCGCGRCRWCLAGDTQVCPDQRQPGFTDPGSFAELVGIVAADHNLVALPDGISAVAAASLGCRFATSFRAVTAHGRLRPGDWLAVHGCGGAGLSAVMIAQALGARVIAIDVSEGALQRAGELGAEVLLHNEFVTPEELAAAVVSATGGVAVSVDAIGLPAVVIASVLSLQRRGRHVQVGLLLGEHARPAIPMDRVISWELEVLGSHGMAARDYPAMLAMIEDGRLDPLQLVGRTAPLSEAGAALAAMDGPGLPGMTVLLP